MKAEKIFEIMNELGTKRVPFFFMVNFLKTEGMVFPLTDLPENIHYQIEKKTSEQFSKTIDLKIEPISLEEYQSKFQIVYDAISRGDTYLCNLTQPTKISTEASLKEIYQYSDAKFKLLTDDFVCFSPERFVKIKNGKIYSYPMKGTIDASILNAEEIILNDEKEAAEHATIVDLIRNDLSIVSENVNVKKYRYIDHISTNNLNLLQVSSEIEGTLPTNYHHHLGDLLDQLLPAGSICGAPKPKTIATILEAEQYDRNYYTGVFGVFDGENLDSAVMIRFIEQHENALIYKSGGGITHMSNAESEYQELIQKIYVPIR